MPLPRMSNNKNERLQVAYTHAHVYIWALYHEEASDTSVYYIYLT